MPADLSPLAAANELVRRLRCGGIIARRGTSEFVVTRGGVRCGLSSNYFDHLFFSLLAFNNKLAAVVLAENS